MTYTDYIRELLLQKPIGMPIYTKIIAASLAEKFNLKDKDAVAAAAVAMKRIMDLFQNSYHSVWRKRNQQREPDS